MKPLKAVLDQNLENEYGYVSATKNYNKRTIHEDFYDNGFSWFRLQCICR